MGMAPWGDNMQGILRHRHQGLEGWELHVAISAPNNISTSSSQEREPGVEEDEDAWNIWSNINKDWDFYYKKKNAYLKELVRKGIPHHFRPIVWQYLCGAMDSDVKKLYKEYINQTSACEKVIRRDIARTYPEHDFFKEKDGMGQESLFNVMKAYSLQDREVGYCQGSGFIVGLLLMQMPEEEAFAIFVKIMQDYKMRDMFKPSMAQLGLCMYQLENLVQELLPELHCHFQAQSFHTSMYASSWFLTLFTTALALPTAYRIIDVFLSEGMDIIFKVALALLGIGKEALLSLDMEGMLKKLRNENRLLRGKVELLEAESSELADRLVRGQVSRAEEEETTYVVQRELLALRHTHLDTAHTLELAQEEIRHLRSLVEANHNSCQSSMDEASLSKEKLTQREEMIKCLQDELVKVRLTVAESDALVRDLRARIEELEEEKKTLRESTVDNSVAHLQEELIAVKLREAEANLSLKDLKQSVAELNAAWLKHLQERKPDPAPAPDSTPKKIGNLLNWNSTETQRLEEDLMSTRLREMEAVTELKQLRLKVIEVETRADDVNPDKKRDQNQNNIKDLSQKSNVQISTVNGPQKDSQKLNGPQMMYTFPRFRQSIIKRSNRNDCCEGSNDDKPRSQEVKCRSLGRPTRVRVAQTPSRSSFKRLLFPFRSKRRQIEADAKSLNSFSNHSGHSRKSSDTSQISLVSVLYE
ncbi:ecotropic viral integration site 5 ortholog-like [Diaphorina citri]|uniref:Ecotropic viral integration site 5 ortholog-like n=3 Tax=Diaphorina citri TaxID=121845 RepID=A0A3Q0IJ13_DIACI|nr:ecotropic viral integration site 5 ortholog-like [Diaphorina citri]